MTTERILSTRYERRPRLAAIDFTQDGRRYHDALRAIDSMGLRSMTLQQVEMFSKRYQENLLRCLKESNDMQMKPAYLEGRNDLPPNSEALIIGIGGTNIYGAIVRTAEDGQPHLALNDSGRPIYCRGAFERRQFSDVHDFFSTITSTIEPVLQVTAPDAIGIVYSFPADAQRTAMGVDMRSPNELPKGFVIPGIEGKLVGETLLEQLSSQYHIPAVPVAVMNDGPATRFTQGDQIGAVLGTGFNFSITLNGETYNVEPGRFNDIPTYALAEAVDAQSSNPGKVLTGKQVSGMYMGDQLHIATMLLAQQGLIPYQLVGRLNSINISDIINMNRMGLQKRIKGHIDATTFGIISAVAGRIRSRSAQIFGTMLGTIIHTFPDDFASDKIKVTIDGSVWDIPGYEALARKFADQISGKDVTCRKVEHASLLGAGRAAIGLLPHRSSTT